jgi:peptide/nickel transport system substrate-binding protein
MLRGRMRGQGLRRRGLAACVAAVGLVVLAAACGPVSAGSADSVGTTPVSGGTVTYASLPGLNVDYIFPFETGSNFSVGNTNDFQYLLYRPLYWFGQGSEPYLNTALSLAYPPVYKGQQVTIKLKKYRWSNGQLVTAQDVVFWINMQIEDGLGTASEPNIGYGGEVAGDFPSDVSNVQAVGTTEVTMTITKPFSEDWFTDNELSQITPMPSEWDRTAAGPSSCDTTPADCTAVYNYLATTAANMNSWAASPIWSIVDGPWRVQRASASSGWVYLAYNNRYSGPVAAHHISEFVIVPFTTEEAEFNVLEDPQGNQRIDVGYLPTDDAPVPAPGATNGGNPLTLSDYKLTVLYPWELSYAVYNYTDSTAGAIFSQLYFRQALQSLVDQEGVIDGPMHGYGKAVVGPVTSYPLTKYLSPQVQSNGDLWPLNLGYAKSLLTAHGWRVVPNGVDTCVSQGSGPTQCGPGVKAGATLNFTMDYATGIDYMYSSTKELVSNASLVGIKITAVAQPFDTVVGTVFGCGTGCNTWQLAEWGSWTYSPDYLPTGEELFESSSPDDAGIYNNAHDNTLIGKTLDARTPAAFESAMYKWEDYLADQLPVIYEPNAATLIEAVDNLHIGVQNPTLNINPEDWYYLK